MKEERVMVDRRGSQWKKYLGYGLTAFIVIAAAIILIFVFVRNEDFSDFTGKIWKALKPVVVGGVFAYLMNPLMVFFETRLRNFFYKHAKSISRANKTARAISVVITLICVLLLISFLMYLLIPQLYETISGIIEDRFILMANVENWYNGLELEKTAIGEYIEIGYQKVSEYVEDFVNTRLVDTATSVVSSVATGVKNVIGAVYNVLIGLIFSIYMLGSKEKLASIAKKMLYAFFKRKKANTLLRIARQCHTKFIDSITGKIVDSAIIGLLCFVAMMIIDIPYATLVSVIVGVTNVIPFFGPFIGAIPSAILIFFASPIKCLYFIIMIFVLQQFDGNFLTPKIVGDSIGLSPLWVLFACTVFGSLWGVVGMLVGVPLMACIYMIIKEIVEDRLHSKGLRTETIEYRDLEYVDETEMFCKVVDVVPGEEPEGLPFPEPTAHEEDSEEELPKEKEPENGTGDAKKADASGEENEQKKGSAREKIDKLKGLFHK